MENTKAPENTQQLIDRLYALRAGMSLISMQKDRIYEIYSKIDKVYEEIGTNFEEEVRHIAENYYPTSTYLTKRDQRFLPTIDNEGFDWKLKSLSLMECENIEYSQLELLQNKYQYDALTNVLKSFNRKSWSDYGKPTAETNDKVREWVENLREIDNLYSKYLIDKIEKNIVAYSGNVNPSYSIVSLAFGEWLLTDEYLDHLRTKTIDMESLAQKIDAQTPHGGLAKLFNKAKVERNQKMQEAVTEIKTVTKLAEKMQSEYADKTQELNSEIADIVNDCNRLTYSLQEEFCDLLDIRDWENIDLVIYFLETGRAESIKEALQQVDYERRTDRIVETINSATKRICETISIGFATINNTIRQCFASLENRISEQNALLQQNSTRLAQLTSATNLNTALLNKQSVASKDLMKEIKLLKSSIKND